MEAKLELYRIFKEVAEHESISAAAKTLYLSQPAVSQSVKHLEEQLHTALFVRGKRGVELTREGRMLYEYVRGAMGLLESAEEKVRQARELEIGQLVIGASDTLTREYLLPCLEAFRRSYPGIRLSLRNGTSRQVLRMLREGKVDMAFASIPEESAEYRVEKCFDTHMIFVAAPGYACDFERTHTLAEVARMPLILLDRQASSRLYLEKRFESLGLTLRPELELSTHDLLLALAQIGLGVACVTQEFSRPFLEQGLVRPLRTAPVIPPRQVVMCTLPQVEHSPAVAHFMEVARGNGRQ